MRKVPHTIPRGEMKVSNLTPMFPWATVACSSVERVSLFSSHDRETTFVGGREMLSIFEAISERHCRVLATCMGYTKEISKSYPLSPCTEFTYGSCYIGSHGVREHRYVLTSKEQRSSHVEPANLFNSLSPKETTHS